VLTKKAIGRMAMASSASISSLIRIAPNWALTCSRSAAHLSPDRVVWPRDTRLGAPFGDAQMESQRRFNPQGLGSLDSRSAARALITSEP
jgi:hypothetical protein